MRIETLLGELPFLAAAYYALTPLLIRATNKMPAAVQHEDIGPQDFPATIANFFETQAKGLEQVGFHRVAYLRIRGAAGGAGGRIDNYLIMLRNRATGDGAMVVAMVNVTAGAETVTSQYVEFSTRYADGRMFDTLNSADLASFGPVASEIKTRVPSVSDPRLLFGLHRFVIAKHHVTTQPIGYDESNVAGYLQEERVESLDGQVKCGRFYRNKSADTYRPTLKGAYLMTWGQLWPIKIFRRLAMERRARQTLQEFHAANPTLPPLPPLSA